MSRGICPCGVVQSAQLDSEITFPQISLASSSFLYEVKGEPHARAPVRACRECCVLYVEPPAPREVKP